MKRKGIFLIFMIMLCLGCLFGCGRETEKTKEGVILHAGAGAWEMEYIWESAGGVPYEKEACRGSYIYDGLSPEEYLIGEAALEPVVLIANSRLGYKISLGTGQYYRMRSGDRLFLKRSADVEVYGAGLLVEKKSIGCGQDICELYREYGNRLFQMLQQGREFLFYQCSRQKGKLYITYF